ncbi:hypothetical protein J6590_071008 [Homalodisca vitripennis]|nr:hypothetical protein J6590_071008 [Homalodisca vitripennis]
MDASHHDLPMHLFLSFAFAFNIDNLAVTLPRARAVSDACLPIIPELSPRLA